MLQAPDRPARTQVALTRVPRSPGLLKNPYLWLGLAALAIAALSLLIPSTPSYDPWAWLGWGREILHGSLHTPGGPSWKPLPVLLTTPLALFGGAQPNLWLLIARAGAVVAVAMTGWLAARLTWCLRTPDRDAASGVERAFALAPGILAAGIAMVSMVLYGTLLTDSALGYSEGIATAGILIALERHIDGHLRQAFIFGLVAALDRPEFWIVWGPYGLWLMWKDPGSRGLVIGLAVLCLLLWFVPQKWGGGSFTSGVTRAQHPRAGSAAFAKCPFCSELADDAWPLILLRVKLAALLAVVAAAAAVGLRRRRAGSWRPSNVPESAAAGIALSALFGFGWWVLVALETQSGFSGNTRYLVIGNAFINLAGAAGFGWLTTAFTRRALRSRGALGPVVTTALSALCGLMLFAFVPHWVGPSLASIPRTHRSLLYQARLRADLASLINHRGGPEALLGCGDGAIAVEGLQVPMIAWYLGVSTDRLDGHHPAVVPWPSVILQDRSTQNAALLPGPQQIVGWERAGARYTVQTTKTMRLFTDCRSR